MIRRSLLLLGAFAVLGLFFAGCGDTDSTTAMYRESPQRDGVCATAGPKLLHDQAWKISPAPDRTMPHAPVISDGVAYFGDMYSHVYATDVETGKKLWGFKTNDRVFGSPVFYRGVVYFGDEDGCLYAVMASGGGEKWRFKTKDPVYNAPLVVDDTVYFTSGGEYLFAVDGDKGSERWMLRLPDGGGRLTPIACIDGTLFVGSESVGKLFAVTMETGALLWTCEVDIEESICPAVSGGMVFLGGDNLYAVAITTGRIVWTHEAHGITSSPSVLDGVVYFGENRHMGGKLISSFLVALGTVDGHEMWRYEYEEWIGSTQIADGMIYCTHGREHVVAVDLSGQELWTFELPGELHTDLAVTTDKILYGGYGEIYAVK